MALEDLSYCALKYNECEAYIATKNDDSTLRQELAKKWSGPDY